MYEPLDYQPSSTTGIAVDYLDNIEFTNAEEFRKFVEFLNKALLPRGTWLPGRTNV
jgi:hypothetical protein